MSTEYKLEVLVFGLRSEYHFLIISQFIVNTKKHIIIDFTCTVFALEVQYFQNEVSS